MAEQARDTALVALEIEWRSQVARHRDRYYSSSTMPAHRQSSINAGQFEAGQLVPAHDTELVLTVPRHLLRLPTHYAGAPAGRVFPQAMFAEVLGQTALHHGGARVVSVDDENVRVDLNHPLSLSALELSIATGSPDALTPAAQVSGDDRALAEFLDSGPGLQAPHPHAPAEFFANYPFTRDDEQDDAVFYAPPRLVQHIDSSAISVIESLYEELLDTGMRVLDLLSSWKSHLPKAWGRLDGVCLGMNARELEHNEQLPGRVVHDLNRRPRLPFDHESFDAVICNVSVEYLTQPLEVFSEVFRVLRPGGIFINTFSDRCFPTKAIRLWQYLHTFERLQFVLSLYLQHRQFSRLHTQSVRGLPRPTDDDSGSQHPHANPVFAVYGYRD